LNAILYVGEQGCKWPRLKVARVTEAIRQLAGDLYAHTASCL